MRRTAQRVVRRPARAWRYAVVLAALAASSSARAEQRREHVDVSIFGGSDPALEVSIAELLVSDGLTAHFSQALRDRRHDATATTSAGHAVAVVQLDLGREGVLEIRVVDPLRRRVVVRELPVPHGIDEIVREEASHIVVYAVEAITRGEEIGVPQQPPVPAEAKTKAEPGSRLVARAPRRGLAVELETLGTVRSYASVAPAVFGTGAALTLSSAVGNKPSDVRLGGALSFEQRSAIVVSAQPLMARFVQRSLRFAFVGDVPLSSWIALRASTGAALDLVDVTNTPLRPTSQPRRTSFVDVVPVIDVTGGLRFQLAPRLAASALVGIEVPLSTSDYVVEDTRERDLVLLSPSPVRVVGRFTFGVRF